MTMYLIRAVCPACRNLADLVERTGNPVGRMQDVRISVEHCPGCGAFVEPGGWDVHEETRIKRVKPEDEVR